MTFLLKNKILLILLLINLLITPTLRAIAAPSSFDFCQMAVESGGIGICLPKSEINDCFFQGIFQGAVGSMIANITPFKIPRGSTLDLLISALNTQFNTSSTVQIEGITVNQINPISPTKIYANVTVPNDSTVGSHPIRVTTLGNTVENTCLLQVEAETTPKILSISPSIVEPGFTGLATIYGINTHFSTETQINLGDGITSSVTRVISPTQLEISLTVPADVNPVHDITTITGSEVAQGDHLLLVASLSKLPTIVQVEPNHAQQGLTVTLNVIGNNTHFTANVTALSLGENIEVKSIQVQNETQLTVEISIAEKANLGVRDIVISTAAETVGGFGQFSVEPAIVPVKPIINLSANKVNEDSPIGTTVGTFSTTPSGNDTYELLDNAEGRFKIVGNTLQIADKTKLIGDQQVTIRVQVIRQGQEPISETFTILIQSVNHAPTDITLSKATVPAHSAVGTEVGQLSTMDRDANDSHQYTLVEDIVLFAIKGNSLQIANNDFTDGNYEITVRSTDKAGLSFDKSFKITVTPVKEGEVTVNHPEDDNTGVVEPPVPPPSDTVVPPESGGEIVVTGDTTGSETGPVEEQPSVSHEDLPNSKEPVAEDKPLVKVTDEVATPTTNSGSVITVDECQPKSNLMIYPIQKTLTLKVGDEPLVLEFSGGQGEVTITQQPDQEIIGVESFDFPRLRLSPLKVGETEMTLQDCAGHEAVVNIIVEAPEPLQPQQQTLTLFMAEPSMTVLFTGECQASLRQSPNPEMITLQETHFPAEGGAKITLFARKVGVPTPLVIADDCGHTATVNLSVEAIDPCVERTTTTMDVFLVKNEKPTNQWITSELNYLDFIQTPNGTIVDLQFDTHEAGGTKLTFTPGHAGQTTMKLKTSECNETEINITVFSARTLAHLCWLDQRTDGICQNPDDKQVLAPNALGINWQGVDVETTAYFSSQQSEGRLKMLVVIDEEHVNQPANLLIVAINKVGNAQYSLMYDGQTWQKWDDKLDHLTKAKFLQRLPPLLEIEETIPLEQLKGLSTIYVGYQLENGTIVFNGQNPLLFKGSNASKIVDDTTIKSSSARFEGTLNPTNSTGQKREAGLVVVPTEAMTLSMKMTVEKTDIGQATRLILVISQRLDDGKRFFTLESNQCRDGVENFIFNINSHQRWIRWDGDFAHLEKAHSWDSLQETMQFQCPLSLDTLPLDGIYTGEFTVYVGYRLGNDVIVFNGLEPLKFRFSDLSLPELVEGNK